MKNSEYEIIVKDLEKLLSEICKDDRFRYHIVPVVNISQKMANELQADIQVVTIASYLHDVTKMLGDSKDHHITGAKYAREFLQKYEIEEDKIKLIEKCIINHRGIPESKRETLEERIVATADSIAHFEHPLTLFYAWYGKRQCSIDEGAEGIKNKIQRSWNKIEFEEKKEELKDKYKNLMNMLMER